MTTRALITGVTGQDGSYLAELLLSKGYEVHGILRPQHQGNFGSLPCYMQHLLSRIRLHYADLGDASALKEACRACQPDEIYHLGGPTRVDGNLSGHTVIFQLVFGSTKALLEAIADCPKARFLLAGTAEMIGAPVTSPQSEQSVRNPRSLYGFSKLAASDLVAQHRSRFGTNASTAILFNHESPRREPYFLSRKVTRGLARVSLGLQPKITLGNLDARRDWGYAPDYVDAMCRIATQAEPGDYVVATGKTHTVRELVAVACDALGLNMEKCVVQDNSLFRPIEPVSLCGDFSKLSLATSWAPVKSFTEMISEMSACDLATETAAHKSYPIGI